MTKIKDADPHYIRCIKPNMNMVPAKADGAMMMDQLLKAGVLATVKIRQNGYCYRVIHKNFVAMYTCALGPKAKGKKCTSAEGWKAAAEELIAGLPRVLPSLELSGPTSFAVGSSKVFMGTRVFKALEDARRDALGEKVSFIQATIRGVACRRLVAPKRHLRDELSAVLRKFNLEDCLDEFHKHSATPARWNGDAALKRVGGKENLEKAMSEIEVLIDRAEGMEFKNRDVLVAEHANKRMSLEMDALAEVGNQVQSMDPIAIEKTIARLNGLHLTCEELPQLEARMQKLRTQIPLVKAMKKVLEEVEGDTEDPSHMVTLAEMMDTVAEAGLGADSGEWLLLEGAELFAKIQKLKEEGERKKREEAEKRAAELAAEEAKRAAERAAEQAAEQAA